MTGAADGRTLGPDELALLDKLAEIHHLGAAREPADAERRSFNRIEIKSIARAYAAVRGVAPGSPDYRRCVTLAKAALRERFATRDRPGTRPAATHATEAAPMQDAAWPAQTAELLGHAALLHQALFSVDGATPPAMEETAASVRFGFNRDQREKVARVFIRSLLEIKEGTDEYRRLRGPVRRKLREALPKSESLTRSLAGLADDEAKPKLSPQKRGSLRRKLLSLFRSE